MLVFGAGAVGTYIGGSLALHGNDCVFLVRPQTRRQIAAQGMHLHLHGSVHQVADLKLATSMEEALVQEPFDVAIFAVKSYDTRAALEDLDGFQGSDLPPFLCLQNGVDNEAELAQVLGPDRVIAGTVTSAIGRLAPGEVILDRQRGVGIAADHPLSSRLAAAMNGAGLNAKLYASASEMKWSKLLTNLLANASAAILDMTPDELFADPRLYALELAQLREALAVMAAREIGVVDLPGTPVRTLAFLAKTLPAALSRPILRRAVGRGRGAKMPSFHIDLRGGRGVTEVGYLNGAVVRHGEEPGVRTPANRFLTETLLSITAGTLPMDAFSGRPDRFLAAWDRHRVKTSR